MVSWCTRVVELYCSPLVLADGHAALRVQEGTDKEERLYASATTADGNVVLAGHTLGNWNGTQAGYHDAAVAKINAQNGEVIWRYMVRTTNTLFNPPGARREGCLWSVSHLFFFSFVGNSWCFCDQVAMCPLAAVSDATTVDSINSCFIRPCRAGRDLQKTAQRHSCGSF